MVRETLGGVLRVQLSILLFLRERRRWLHELPDSLNRRRFAPGGVSSLYIQLAITPRFAYLLDFVPDMLQSRRRE
jgi:hypothetical protein